MTPSTRHLSIHVDRTRDDVYAYASNPENLPAWALGLGGSIERDGDEWIAPDTPMGRVTVAFVPPKPRRLHPPPSGRVDGRRTWPA
ncbi:hypothetical protein [Streptomyces sp. NEAU-H3]|uniref:hypothetical protein n=1 Tax=Streptomyces sp. NEAU-H3 TaxID=2720636 RepID=UPI001FD77569|nr:hypothetical protein [Streptomyces sp. NEAU-H3]